MIKFSHFSKFSEIDFLRLLTGMTVLASCSSFVRFSHIDSEMHLARGLLIFLSGGDDSFDMPDNMNFRSSWSKRP